MAHPHDKTIRAWLDGAQVQFLDHGVWRDIQPAEHVTKMPHFYRDSTYRLKPLQLRARQALMYSSACGRVRSWVAVANTLEEETQLARDRNFVRWLGDWVDFVDTQGEQGL
jgi:hypothetical protein